jgi:hypothetical protein
MRIAGNVTCKDEKRRSAKNNLVGKFRDLLVDRKTVS